MVACLVLAAGLGTRLRPLTDTCPKALVPIGDRSALAHAVEAAKRAGAVKVAANAHHHADLVARACDALGILCSREETLLGTAGGLEQARTLLGEGDVLVWNADIYGPEIDGAALVAAHARSRALGASATLLVRTTALGSGNVGWDEEGRITRLRRETVREGERASGEFLGIHVVGPDLPRVAAGCLVGDVYLPALWAGAHLCVLCTDVPTHDIGSPRAYLAANAAWLAARGERSYCGRNARVENGARVDGSVVGEGAVVLADAIDSVVWPGAALREAVRGAVVTTSQIVRVD